MQHIKSSERIVDVLYDTAHKLAFIVSTLHLFSLGLDYFIFYICLVISIVHPHKIVLGNYITQYMYHLLFVQVCQNGLCSVYHNSSGLTSSEWVIINKLHFCSNDVQVLERGSCLHNNTIYSQSIDRGKASINSTKYSVNSGL